MPSPLPSQYYDVNYNPVIIGLMFVLLIIMTICSSIVVNDHNPNASIQLPQFLSSRYFYILSLSFWILIISFTNTAFMGPDYLSIMLLLIGIIGDIFITIYTKR
jgi:membrane-bound ClpP family serine protease